MKTIVVAYKDAAGLSGGTVIAGPDDGKQFEIMEAATGQHIFPSGYKRLELYPVGGIFGEPDQVAEWISDDVGKFVQGNQAKILKASADAKKSSDAADERAEYTKAASECLHKAADSRNRAIGAAAAQRDKLSLPLTQDKDRASIQTKVEDLEVKSKAAAEAFNVVLAAFNAVKNPRSTPRELEKALLDLGIKKSISPVSEQTK